MLSKPWRLDLTLHRPGFDGLTLTCLVLLVFQCLVAIGGGYESNLGLYHELGLNRVGIFDGKIWQLGSYALLHGGWLHFLLNVAMIYLLGGKLAHILGMKSAVRIFWGGVLLGGLCHACFYPGKPLGVEGEVAFAPLVGASGGAMALLFALTTLSPQSRMWPIPVSGRNLALGVAISAILLHLSAPGVGLPGLANFGEWAVSYQLEELFQMSHVCHLGGALGGWILAKKALGKPITLADLRRARAERENEMAA